MNSIHRKSPGQSGMIHLIWFSRIRREIVALTQNCTKCIKIGNNLKPIFPKNITSQLPAVQEPNEEVQMDFAGPITDEHFKDIFIELQ